MFVFSSGHCRPASRIPHILVELLVVIAIIGKSWFRIVIAGLVQSARERPRGAFAVLQEQFETNRIGPCTITSTFERFAGVYLANGSGPWLWEAQRSRPGGPRSRVERDGELICATDRRRSASVRIDWNFPVSHLRPSKPTLASIRRTSRGYFACPSIHGEIPVSFGRNNDRNQDLAAISYTGLLGWCRIPKPGNGSNGRLF